jgi:GntR family transcriptional regulator
MHMVDGTPYYLQLKEMLIEEIESGKLKNGDKIPSERDLAAEFNVSRMTARNAINHLEREGYVERKVGMGTFVSTRKYKWNFITVNSLTKSMQEKGLKPTTKLLHMEQEEADEFLAATLQLQLGENVLSIRRLRLVDDVPIAIELTKIPYKFCEGIEQYMGDDVSLYHVLTEYYDITPVKQRQIMRISLSDYSQSKLLKIKDDSPCLLIRGTTTDPSDKVIEYVQTLARGDLVEFYSETITDL